MHSRVAADPALHKRASIHPESAIGTVSLTVSDLERSRAFYERALGLAAFENEPGVLALGLADQHPLIELHGDRSAPPLDRRATGLFHLAILVPTRLHLAQSLARLTRAGANLDGASDHLVSEALYLSDPDGNGIEIYRDRPSADWPRSAEGLQMATLPLDLRSLLGELPASAEIPAEVPAGTHIGHVHLQVAELEQTERFYSDVLGFDVVVRTYPGALFVSAGGYHHHVGLNTWHSAGSAPPQPGSIGLRSFEVVLPDSDELERVLERVRAAELPQRPQADGVEVRDPSGNALLLTVRQGPTE